MDFRTTPTRPFFPLRSQLRLAALVAALVVGSCSEGTSPTSPEAETETSDLLVVLANLDSIPSVGDTLVLRAATRTPILQTVPATEVNWFSSDPSIIKVDSLGRAISVGVGVVVISAAYRGHLAKTKLHSDPALAQLEIVLPLTPISVGTVTTFGTHAIDVHGRGIPGQKVRWSSGSPNLLTVSKDGEIEALRAGTAQLHASAGEVSTTVNLNIEESRTGKVEIASGDISLEEGLRTQLEATVTDRDGKPVPDASVIWDVWNKDRASISDGALFALRAGSTSVLAKSGGKADTVSLTVTPTRVETISLEPASSVLEPGAILTLDHILQDASGAELHDRTLQWTTSDPLVATVSKGKIVALEPGLVTITASVGGKTGTATVSVSVDEGGGGGGEPPRAAPREAFPGAEGWGAQALTSCSRDAVQVLRVTSLNDSGSGSLRRAIADARNGVLSIVTFDVAGRINLASEIALKDMNCLYIAGQTAPGGGITISSPTEGFITQGDSRDIVIRYLRFRGGFRGDYRGHVNVYIGAGTDIMFDHLSTSWTTDKLIVIWKGLVAWARPIHRITVSNTILSEVLAAHPTAMQVAGQDNDGATEWRNMSKISIHRNLFAHNSHRNPMVNSHETSVTNNVIYNWKQGVIQSTREAELDAINNYMKPGPMSDSRYLREVTWGCYDGLPTGHPSGNDGFEPSIYVSGNHGPTNGNPWASCYYKTGGNTGAELPARFRRPGPLGSPVNILSPAQAYEEVVADAGASARLACAGGWVSNRDPVDIRVINDVRRGTGPSVPIAHENEVGGFPHIAAAAPCADSDGDGMPNEFEDRNGLDKSDASDALLDKDGDGYTNLEEYVNGETSP